VFVIGLITNPRVPLQPIVNLYHFDWRSPPDPQQELAVVISCVPNPAFEVVWVKLELSQRIEAFEQSCPATGGGELVVMHVVNVPVAPVPEIV
jgi:hypothetical protein